MKYHIMMKQFKSNSKKLIRSFLLSAFCLTLSVNAFSQIDIGVYGLVAPLAPHTGAINKSITVKIRNYGSVAITNIKVGWKINGMVQPTYSQ
jgi:hypothetical protein